MLHLDQPHSNATKLEWEVQQLRQQLAMIRAGKEKAAALPTSFLPDSFCPELPRCVDCEELASLTLAPPEEPTRRPLSQYLTQAKQIEEKRDTSFENFVETMQKGKNEAKVGNTVIVLPELTGNPLAEDVRAQYATMALSLALSGHNVTVLLLGQETRARVEWINMLAPHARRFSTHVSMIAKARSILNLGPDARMSFTVLQWLLIHSRTNPFDVIHFPDYKGLAFYTLVAKRLNLGLTDTQVVVNLQGPTPWIVYEHFHLELSPEQLETEFLEQRSAQWADVVIASSRFLLKWAEKEGWMLPENTFVLHNQVRKEQKVPEVNLSDLSHSGPIKSLTIILGTHPLREMVLVCDALDLVYQGMTNETSSSPIHRRARFLQIHVLESPFMTLSFGERDPDDPGHKLQQYKEILRVRSAQWALWTAELVLGDPKQVYRRDLITHVAKFGGEGNSTKLLLGNSLFVIPLFSGNTPTVVLETVASAFPLLVSGVGGVPELLAVPQPEATRAKGKGGEGLTKEQDQKFFSRHVTTSLFKPRASELADLIASSVAYGVQVSGPDIPAQDTLRLWRKFHDAAIVLAREGDRKEKPKKPGKPLVSVILVHHNHPELCQIALESLKNQTYRQMEVILVDDASDDAASIAFIKKMEEEFERSGAGRWQVVQLQTNSWTGAARNAGAMASRGEFMLFMDEDDVAKPYQIGALVRAIEASGADVLAPFLDQFQGSSAPVPRASTAPDFGFLGGALGPGLMRNVFGQSNFLIRRHAFKILGGFHELHGVRNEDWQLLSRAALMDLEILPFPSATFWKRTYDSPPSISSELVAVNQKQGVEPYMDSATKVNPAFRSLLRYFIASQQEVDNAELKRRQRIETRSARQGNVDEDKRHDMKKDEKHDAKHDGDSKGGGRGEERASRISKTGSNSGIGSGGSSGSGSRGGKTGSASKWSIPVVNRYDHPGTDKGGSGTGRTGDGGQGHGGHEKHIFSSKEAAFYNTIEEEITSVESDPSPSNHT
eukprot:CAMPEP_0196572348 /NCGR_PEP_ID=MMETSP1081-20130531/2417_1 /TAXON_ID=36882 /ORGANISM="Pyramimonas amylifera, Strain CCMP720" /LENGTH=1004 /DNA_ID=CAMNT_0041889645 /DNA_START=188 /DNA_END=3202 /DNA_ORIENTATION=-